MILLPIYAVLVYVLVARYRRRPLGYAIALVGSAVPLAALDAIQRFVPPSEDVSQFGLRLIIYGDTAFLLVTTLFVASLPRRAPIGMVCPRCHYNLTGLAPAGLTCPECGEAWCGRGSGREEPEPERIPIPKGPIKKRRPHL